MHSLTFFKTVNTFGCFCILDGWRELGKVTAHHLLMIILVHKFNSARAPHFCYLIHIYISSSSSISSYPNILIHIYISPSSSTSSSTSTYILILVNINTYTQHPHSQPIFTLSQIVCVKYMPGGVE